MRASSFYLFYKKQQWQVVAVCVATMGILWIVSGTARFSQCLFVGHAGLSATHHWIFPKQHIKAFSFFVFFFHVRPHPSSTRWFVCKCVCCGRCPAGVVACTLVLQSAVVFPACIDVATAKPNASEVGSEERKAHVQRLEDEGETDIQTLC